MNKTQTSVEVGQQTKNALHHFAIGNNKWPYKFIKNYLILKQSCAIANRDLGTLNGKKTKAILESIDYLLNLKEDMMQYFPLSVWQNGGGDQTNTNINEVIAELANKNEKILHYQDDVNMSQSANDTFASVMHMTAVTKCIHDLMPAINKLRTAFSKLEIRYALKIKIGRTHLQDAAPMTYGQFFSSYQTLLSSCMNDLHLAMDGLFELPIGGTVIGTGFGAPEGFDHNVSEQLSNMLKLPFTPAKNKFALINSHHSMLNFMGCLVNLACTLNKIANDICLLGSSPRSAIGELMLPENEPGIYSIPGKVNPSQCDALSMVCIQTIGSYQSVAMAQACGQLDLNAYKPLIAFNVITCLSNLSDAITMFDKYCIKDLLIHETKTQQNLDESLSLVNALIPILGYEKANEIAKIAYTENIDLKQACLKKGYLSIEKVEELLNPNNMIGNSHSDF